MIGVFIEPKGKCNDFIKRWKKLFKSEFELNNYASHPPHLSIYVGNLKLNKSLILELQKLSKKFNEMEIVINKLDIFQNDIFTNKDTIFLKVKKNNKLLKYQLCVAKIVKNYILSSKKKIKFSNKNLDESYQNFGFPFVGKHWIPHFTLASVKSFDNSNLYKKIIKEKILFKFKINKISLWKINKEKHKKILDIKLN